MPATSASPVSHQGSPHLRPLRRRMLLSTAGAALLLGSAVAGASADHGLGLTEVTAQPKAAGIASPNYLSPELIEFVQAQGSWTLENPSADGVIRYYGYLDQAKPMVTIASGPAPTVEAQKTEPDKNTYLVLRGQHGPGGGYDYGRHFLYQGHEVGPRGYITRINLDADPAHRVTLLASTQAGGGPNTGINLAAGTNLPDFDGSAWNPFTQTLLFSFEGNGTSTGGIWEATPDFPSTVVDRLGLFGRGGFEGIQEDGDGNIWLVEDLGGSNGTASGATNLAKQPNSFVFRFIPKNRSDLNAGGKLQVLQVDGKDGQPVKFGGDPVTGVPTQAQIDADVTSTFMADLHTYGNSFKTRWITVHDTAVDGFATFNANLAAKLKGGTPFKRPENGQFRPGTRFGEFFFTETGDTNALSGANGAPGAGHGGWGGILRLAQKDPSSYTGTLSPFFLGDVDHTGLDNITFLDGDNVISGEDAGDTLHGQRAELDSAFIFPIKSNTPPTPFRFLGEGRDASATIDSAVTGNGNDGDNEITGLHISDGDPTVRGLIGTTEPRFLSSDGEGRRKDGWRFFWTQQHGDNVTYEVINAPR